MKFFTSPTSICASVSLLLNITIGSACTSAEPVPESAVTVGVDAATSTRAPSPSDSLTSSSTDSSEEGVRVECGPTAVVTESVLLGEEFFGPSLIDAGWGPTIERMIDGGDLGPVSEQMLQWRSQDSTVGNLATWFNCPELLSLWIATQPGEADLVSAATEAALQAHWPLVSILLDAGVSPIATNDGSSLGTVLALSVSSNDPAYREAVMAAMVGVNPADPLLMAAHGIAIDARSEEWLAEFFDFGIPIDPSALLPLVLIPATAGNGIEGFSEVEYGEFRDRVFLEVEARPELLELNADSDYCFVAGANQYVEWTDVGPYDQPSLERLNMILMEQDLSCQE